MKNIRRFLVYLVEDVPIIYFVGFFAVMVLGFGFSYSYFMPFADVSGNLKPPNEMSIWEGIYLSIFTVSSLGYSDIRPIAYSRAIACFQVLLGFAVMGIMLAKLTSIRLSYHVSHLFSSNARKYLDDLAGKFTASGYEIKEFIQRFQQIYHNPPVAQVSTDDKEAKARLAYDFGAIISDLKSYCIDLSEEITGEVGQSNFFKIVPSAAVMRVGKAVEETFVVLHNLISNSPPESKEDIFHKENINNDIRDVADYQKKTCTIVCNYAKDASVLNTFQNVSKLCDVIPYFAMLGPSLPDQELPDTDEPQEPRATSSKGRS